MMKPKLVVFVVGLSLTQGGPGAVWLVYSLGMEQLAVPVFGPDGSS